MSFRGKAWSWNATEEDWLEAYPCDRYIHVPYRTFMRAIDVDAPADVVFRWVCQLKVAPYSYDMLDNWFRRSPRELTPGADVLEVGQTFMVGPIVEFAKDRHITAVCDPRWVPVYGHFSLTYAVKPRSASSCHLVCRANLACSDRWERVRMTVLAWGDLIMMRKQFLTLKKLAERTARERTAGFVLAN
jgi:hypothetical protein